MTLHTVIGIGYSNVSLAQIRGLLSKEYANGGFDVLPMPHLHDEARPYELGKAEAQDMACMMAKHYRATICIGIVCVRFLPQNPAFRPAKVDIAMVTKRGHIEDKEVQLNPVTCKRETMGLYPTETVFAHEASEQLIEFIKVRHRSLLLEHFPF